MSTAPRAAATLLLLAAATRPAVSQMCPDGTPPPCRAAVAPRAPVLDSSRWLVLPFENRTVHAEAALLRDGTATLLRLEFERWPDLKVVDDAAVADRLRRLGLEDRTITLSDARALARSFGAGNLVLGEVVPGEHSVRVVARSYSTRTGRRLRQAIAVTTLADSVFTSALGGVAADLLNLARPPSAQGPAVGTQSLEAYREYVLGRLAWGRIDGRAAMEHFRRAVARDSTFALAYYASFLLYATGSGSLPAPARPLARAALRHSSGLPSRERGKIAAAEALARSAPAEACRLNVALLASDSADVDVLSGVNASCCCAAQIVADPRSPSGYGFATSLETYLRAARWALARDTTTEWAFQGIFQRLGINHLRYGCLAESWDVCPLDKQFSAWVLVDHDTLFTIPWPVGGFRYGVPVGDTTSVETIVRATRLKREMVRPYLERWRASFPSSPMMKAQSHNFYSGLGDPERAFQVARDFGNAERAALPAQLARAVFSLWQAGRPRASVALFDSVQQAATAALARGDSSLLGLITGQYAVNVSAALGHLRREWTDTLGYNPWLSAMVRRNLGLGPDSLLPLEADSGRGFRFRPGSLGPDGRPNAAGRSALDAARRLYSIVGFHDRKTLLVADTVDRPPWGLAGGETMALHPYQVFQVRLASGDTAGARGLLPGMDRQLELGAPSHPWLGIEHVFVAESYLEIGDSVAALERLRDFARKFPRSTLTVAHAYYIPRFWVRYGDLAYALHQRDDAIRAYRFISELWADADSLYQPTVQRARTRLAELTGEGS